MPDTPVRSVLAFDQSVAGLPPHGW